MPIRQRTLSCEYQILTDDIDDKAAEALIVGPLLGVFCDHYYESQADVIEFTNTFSGSHRTATYRDGLIL